MHDRCTLTNNIITSSHSVYINSTIIQTIAPLLTIPGLHYATACTDTQSTTSTHGNTFYPNPSPWRQHHLYSDEAPKARNMQKQNNKTKAFRFNLDCTSWFFFLKLQLWIISILPAAGNICFFIVPWVFSELYGLA